MSKSASRPETTPTITIACDIDHIPIHAPLERSMPTAEELWDLPVDQRIELIWESGVRPGTDAMEAVFASCGCLPGKGMLIEMSIQTGLPPNGRFYRGEGRYDVNVWPDGPAAPRPKRRASLRLRRRTRREEEEAMREYERANSLWDILSCGCVEQCIGEEAHAAYGVDEQRRVEDLAKARSELADALASATLTS